MEDRGIVLKQTPLFFYGPTLDRGPLVSAPSVRRHSCDAACQSANMRRMKARLLKKFEDEIHALDKELKTELPKEIKRARELGDLRENAEYQAAKERQRLVESRISM